jgi:twitching motility protein PilI
MDTQSSPVSSKQTAKSDARSRLREFQERIAQRIAQARIAPGITPRLAVRAGDLNLLFELAETGEIVSVPSAMTKVPRTRDWFLGLANVRGQLVGVIDLSRYFGGPATPIDGASRAVLLSSSLGVNAAVLATRVQGLRNVDELSAEPVQVSAAIASFAVSGWRDNAGAQWVEISLGSLAQSEDFLQIGV